MDTVVLSPFNEGLVAQTLGVFSASWRAVASMNHFTWVMPLCRGGMGIEGPMSRGGEVRVYGPGHVGPP